MRKAKHRSSRKIAAAIAVCLFNLTATFAGVLAWFKANDQTEVVADLFQIENKSVEVNSIKLIKYEYEKEVVGTKIEYNYIGDNGYVRDYTYSKEYNSFGYYARYKGNNCQNVNDFRLETINGEKYYSVIQSITQAGPKYVIEGKYEHSNDPVENQLFWIDVDVMNLYDPAEVIYNGGDISKLNCNAIYELELSLYNLTNFYVALNAIRSTNVNLFDDEILLSSCADFDVFFGNEFLTEQEVLANPDPILTSEEIYQKVSLAAKQKNTHAHLYINGDNSESLSEVKIGDYTFNNETGMVKAYVNVNYAVDRLYQYTRELSIRTIKAVYDFVLKFSFSESGGGAQS